MVNIVTERIHVLDKNTINQIAAGEVIDRPASIIKELVENSIDAGATAISVEIKGGGIELIRITDNGSGIAADDIRVAFIRHSTSKIKDAEDLSLITSLGFRGEALASIAAIAEVELVTKTKDAFSAVHYRISGGEELGFEEIGAPDGTSFIIRNVFNNVPVRKKFLKSASTEASYCNEVVERIALSHPGVSFKYINNGRTAIFTNGNGRLKDVIFGIYGRDIASETVEVKFPFVDNSCGKFSENNYQGIRVSGCICKPMVARNNRNTENYFVNGRYIRNSAISKGIEDAYQPYLMQHKYPFTNIFIEIDPAMMDVNVHPTKQEVRFENPQAVYNAVFEACRDALSGRALIHRICNGEAAPKLADQRSAPEPFEKKRREMTGLKELPTNRTASVNDEGNNKKAYIPKETDSFKGLVADADNYLKELSNYKDFFENSPATAADMGTSVKSSSANDIKTGNLYVGSSVAAAENTAVEDAERALSNTAATDSGSELLNVAAKGTESNILTTAVTGNEQAEVNTPDTVTENEVKYVQTSLFENSHAKTKEEFKNIFQKGYTIVGQIFKTYWIIECCGVMYMIDQHAAHEKIIYEKLMQQNESAEAAAQLVSPPIICSLSATESDIVEKFRTELAQCGFTIEHFGGREYAVSSVPFNTFNINPEMLLFELLDALSKEGRNGAALSIKERIATCSCKAAVKGNTELSETEAKALIKQLLEADNPFNCPHGRPIIIDMTKGEIEKKFKRII